MTPEELARLDKIESLLLEINRKFDAFTAEKKQRWNYVQQRWKDEQARRRERPY